MPGPKRLWPHHLQHWLSQRQPRTDTLRLTQRNVYILPTRAGLMLGLTLLLLLVSSANYQLNLGYLLTYWLTGCALVGMLLCQANLRGLVLHLSPPAPAHAGQAVMLGIQLSSTSRRTRHGLALGMAKSPDSERIWTEVPPQAISTLQLAWPAPARGWHALPTLQAHTLFPLGTFRAWCLWRPALQVLVYPSPEAQPPPLPEGPPSNGLAQQQPTLNTGEPDGIRAYRRGDAAKTVLWKKAAQTFAAGRDDLLSRDSAGSHDRSVWLDATSCGGASLEARLSRLCAWVLMAEAQGVDYGLRLPGVEIAPAQGPAHRAQCLEALALC
jgi:uncharacterized protein (DUF58 family)